MFFSKLISGRLRSLWKRSYPRGWCKTLEDLRRKKRRVTPEEMGWARAYERDQLKNSGVRFPENGELYEAHHDVEVNCLRQWRAPFTGGHTALLPAGTKLRVTVRPSDREPISVDALPLDYEGMQAVLISSAESQAPKYDGYSIIIKTANLGRDFQLTGGAPKQAERFARTYKRGLTARG